MEREEQRLLVALGWASKGLIASSSSSSPLLPPLGMVLLVGVVRVCRGSHQVTSRRGKAPPFRLLLCDMDGA